MKRIFLPCLLLGVLIGCQTAPPDTSAEATPKCRREEVTGSNITRCASRETMTEEERRAARETLEGMREDQMRRHLPRPPSAGK